MYGVASMLISALELIRPDYIVAALDGTKPTFRVEEFTSYKAHRKPMEDALFSQLPKVFELLEAFGIKQALVDGYEADDVIGTLDKRFGAASVEVVIVSNDRDLWQLVDDNTVLMVPKRGSKEADWLGPREVASRLGFSPDLLPDYKGLCGDSSDNIPGVYGVGGKTAEKLIHAFGGMEDIYRNVDKVTPESLKKKLVENTEQAFLSKRLATIVTDVPVDIKLEDCKYHEFNKVEVKKVLEKYNFRSLIKRLGFEVDSKSKTAKVADDQLSLFS